MSKESLNEERNDTIWLAFGQILAANSFIHSFNHFNVYCFEEERKKKRLENYLPN